MIKWSGWIICILVLSFCLSYYLYFDEKKPGRCQEYMSIGYKNVEVLFRGVSRNTACGIVDLGIPGGSFVCKKMINTKCMSEVK